MVASSVDWANHESLHAARESMHRKSFSEHTERQSLGGEGDMLDRATSEGGWIEEGKTQRIMRHYSDNPDDAWEIALSRRSEDVFSLKTRLQDVVLVGHSDGSVFCWGVSLPDTGDSHSQSSCWVPHQVYQCGESAVNWLQCEQGSGIIVIGNTDGDVVIVEGYDSTSRMFLTDRLRYLRQIDIEQASSHSPSSRKFVYVEKSFREKVDEIRGDDFHPDEALLSSKFSVSCPLTSSLFIPELVLLVLGTQKGEVFVCQNIDNKSNTEVSMLESLSYLAQTSGAVVGLHYSSYWLASSSSFSYNSCSVPAVYIIYESGFVVIVHAVTLQVLATNGGNAAKTSNGHTHAAVIVSVVTSVGKIVPWIHPAYEKDADGVITMSRIDPTSSFPRSSASPSTSPAKMGSNSPNTQKTHSSKKKFIPAGHASKLMVVHESTLYTFDLSKFVAFDLSYPSPSSSHSAALKTCNIYEFEETILAGSIICKDKGVDSEAHLCIVDCKGQLSAMSLPKTESDVTYLKAKGFSADLVRGMISNHSFHSTGLLGGVFLPNGTLYAFSQGFLLLSGTASPATFTFGNAHLPDRALRVQTLPSAPHLQLHNGRAEEEEESRRRRLIIAKRLFSTKSL